MQRLTVGQALKQVDPDGWQTYIYICHDRETYLYIGISDQPYTRLEQHLGRGVYGTSPSPLGELITYNYPDSLQWFFDVYKVEDIVPDIRPDQISLAACRGTATWVEKELIKKHGPCLNTMGNRGTPKVIPEKYRYRRFANEGVIITEEE